MTSNAQEGKCLKKNISKLKKKAAGTKDFRFRPAEMLQKKKHMVIANNVSRRPSSLPSVVEFPSWSITITATGSLGSGGLLSSIRLRRM